MKVLISVALGDGRTVNVDDGIGLSAIGCEAGEGGDLGALDTGEDQKVYLRRLGAALGPVGI